MIYAVSLPFIIKYQADLHPNRVGPSGFKNMIMQYTHHTYTHTHTYEYMYK